MTRELDEELQARVEGLEYLGVVENIFTLDGERGHEIVFVYTGRLVPEPAAKGAVLIEGDGSHVPVVWRPFNDADSDLPPLYPTGAVELSAASATQR